MVQEPPCSADGPRNIVLLSDGTGNSAASLRRTNVWRIYEALDLSSGDQLALYDNGVGTSTFRPLAMLGGAVGWGLKRNVRDLYVFVCRNYRPPLARPKPEKSRPADRIYALGFSRGAFTIRVLVDLIGHQGLITPEINGRMVLFVNDAIAPLPWWNYFFENNDGSFGQVEISKVEAKTGGAPAAGAQ